MALALTRPSAALFDSWAEAIQEYGGVHIHGSGLAAPAIADRATCDALIAKAEQLADTRRELPDGLVHNDMYWITEAEEVLGFISLRHELNASLREMGGHIGYSVRPSRRNRGYGSRGLALTLERAKEIGLRRVMLTCDDDNVGSVRIIQNAGGELESISDQTMNGHVLVRRYWIELQSPALR